MDVESKLVPILREGIEVVKMILFKDLQDSLGARFEGRDKAYRNRLVGAVINDLFGVNNPDESFVAFVAKEQGAITEVLENFGSDHEALRIPLTDALRIMVLCDHQEGVDNSALLQRAQDFGVLLVDRELPMPNKFIELVRRVGSAYGILTPPVSTD